MKNRRGLLILCLALVILVSIGCQKDGVSENNEEVEVKVFTTIYPIQFIIKEVGAEIVEVETIYPPGVDAHTFEPTMKDMTEIATSDAFIYFGPTMEGFVKSAAEALDGEDVQLFSLEEHEELFTNGNAEVEVSGHAEADEHEDHDHDGHDHGGRNPHVWIDPLRMITMANIVTEQLIEIAPDYEALFNRNKEDLIKRLEELDDLFVSEMAKKEDKYLIVPHAAYGYWEERYGIEQIAISGLSPSEEPSQKYLAEIIMKADELGINYLFYEQNTPDKLIEIIKNEINANAYTIHNLSVLTEGDMQNEDDYISLMEENIHILSEAFN